MEDPQSPELQLEPSNAPLPEKSMPPQAPPTVEDLDARADLEAAKEHQRAQEVAHQHNPQAAGTQIPKGMSAQEFAKQLGAVRPDTSPTPPKEAPQVAPESQTTFEMADRRRMIPCAHGQQTAEYGDMLVTRFDKGVDCLVIPARFVQDLMDHGLSV